MSIEMKNSESMPVFSPELAARLDALVQRYPVKRSALVPMLLYAQDEVGYLSDAVIAEVARRIGITELDVRSVATYYSMLRFKPAGRFHIQVCTNISCMLRGAYEISERFQEELGIGPKGVTADGLFSLEEVVAGRLQRTACRTNLGGHDGQRQLAIGKLGVEERLRLPNQDRLDGRVAGHLRQNGLLAHEGRCGVRHSRDPPCPGSSSGCLCAQCNRGRRRQSRDTPPSPRSQRAASSRSAPAAAGRSPPRAS